MMTQTELMKLTPQGVHEKLIAWHLDAARKKKAKLPRMRPPFDDLAKNLIVMHELFVSYLIDAKPTMAGDV